MQKLRLVPDRKRPGDGKGAVRRVRNYLPELPVWKGGGVPPACVEADGCARYGAGRAQHAVRASL